jgi:hypothetical protein
MFVSSRNTSEVDRAPEPTTLSITINIDMGDGEPTFDGGESPEA